MFVVAAGNEAEGKTSDCLWWGHRNEDELLTAGEMQSSGDGNNICQLVNTNTIELFYLSYSQ
jgi:hypothetical protein